MLLGFIIFCEVAFWVVLAIGLFVRYALRSNAASNVILLCIPLVDIALLIATTFDLASGKAAEFAHGLAAVYLGFTVVFGSSIIKWSDKHINYIFYNGINPKKESYGLARAKQEWWQWLKGLLACCIAGVLLIIALFAINDAQKTEALQQWFSHMFWLLVIWAVAWPLWYTVFPKRQRVP